MEAVQQQGSTTAALQQNVEVSVGCLTSMRDPPHSCTLWALRPTHNAVLHCTRLQHSWPPYVTRVLVPSCSHLARKLQVLDAYRTF